MSIATVPLPAAPQNGSPVPGLTSIHSTLRRGEYGSHRYPGNCGGYLIRDLLKYFDAQRVFDPMAGSGTCRDVCQELGIECFSADLHSGFDCADAEQVRATGEFDFVWIHPPYFRMKRYSDDPRDLSAAPDLQSFLDALSKVIINCRNVLKPGGHLAVLMGDYRDREAGYMPLTYHTKRLCFEAGLVQRHTDIVRFQHGTPRRRRRTGLRSYLGCTIFASSPRGPHLLHSPTPHALLRIRHDRP